MTVLHPRKHPLTAYTPIPLLHSCRDPAADRRSERDVPGPSSPDQRPGAAAGNHRQPHCVDSGAHTGGPAGARESGAQPAVSAQQVPGLVARVWTGAGDHYYRFVCLSWLRCL